MGKEKSRVTKGFIRIVKIKLQIYIKGDDCVNLEQYGDWVSEMIKSGKAEIERNVETEIYVKGKSNEDVIKKETVSADVITITDKSFIVYK